MYRDVREDDASFHSAIAMMEISSTNVVKILKVELCWESVVVASNQHLPSIEPFHEPHASIGKGYVA
jgi:hypothetical protein